MKLEEARNLIKNTFENPFDKDRFTLFIKNLLKDSHEERTGITSGGQLPHAFAEHIRKMERIGKYEDTEGNIIDILSVELKRGHSIEWARTTQRNFIRRYLNGSRGGELKDAALVAFYSEDSPDWRFSLIKMQYSIEKKADELTPAKRFSFLVGEKESSHTAQNQLAELLTMEGSPGLNEIEVAFNIEAVTREFFTKYRELYLNLNDYIGKEIEKSGRLREELESKEIDSAGFTKKLLGQIVFLYFVQKKGWLGVPKNENWGKGNKQFLRALLDESISKNKNFFSDYLVYLFYEALATEHRGGSDSSYYARLNCRIPFLNGGLFEADYNWEKIHIDIPNKFFTNTLKTEEGDTGTGVLDMFDRYNFTVKEDEPLEKDVAVDPEMLGKVFENLLEVKDRKSKGAFYTPREIVHYMCQESLIAYLDTEVNNGISSYHEIGNKQTDLLGNEWKSGQLDLVAAVNTEIKVPKKDIEKFIREGSAALDHDEAKEAGKLTSKQYALPDTIRTNAKEIDKALANIRICDPAIGSGAFPVGMMNEIVKARVILSVYLKDANEKERTPYELKRHAIQECIYGVDIDHSAIDVAKLRLWLSLVVDEDDFYKIKPLPNLDYKIVCGNSLIGVPDGIMKDDEAEKAMEKLKMQYFGETDHEKKNKLRKDIEKTRDKLLVTANQFLSYRVQFDFKLYFSEVFHEKKGFDIIIGNPPYISTKGIAADFKKILEKIYKFADDSYSHFFFKGVDLLKEKGNLSYITPKTFWTTQTKHNLRELLLKKQVNYIYDTANPFSAVMVDTCITSVVNSSGENNSILFLDGSKDLLNPLKYTLEQAVYLNVQNNVIFKPTDENMKIFNQYGQKVKKLYNQWWDKISTSKNIEKNKKVLDTYRKNLKAGDIALLGCLTEGGQGLATANNGKYVAVRKSTKWAKNILESRPVKLAEAINGYNIKIGEIAKYSSIADYLKALSETEIAELFDNLKEKYGRDIFGQGYIYRLIDDDEIADVERLTDDEKENGINKTKKYYVPYDKGDKDGNRWYLETPFAIAWNKENVGFLKTDPKARYQGYLFYFREGFCWTDVNSTYLKARLKKSGVFDVLSMSLFTQVKIPDWYFVCMINSRFISFYVDNFINNTSHFQINDARQLPIIIPSKEKLKEFETLFNAAVEIKKAQSLNELSSEEVESKLSEIQIQLDQMVSMLYGKVQSHNDFVNITF